MFLRARVVQLSVIGLCVIASSCCAGSMAVVRKPPRGRIAAITLDLRPKPIRPDGETPQPDTALIRAHGDTGMGSNYWFMQFEEAKRSVVSRRNGPIWITILVPPRSVDVYVDVLVDFATTSLRMHFTKPDHLETVSIRWNLADSLGVQLRDGAIAIHAGADGSDDVGALRIVP